MSNRKLNPLHQLAQGMVWQSRTGLVYCCCLVAKSCPTLQRLHGLQPTSLLSPLDFPGKNTGVGCHFLLQGILLTQGSNLGLLHCRQTLYCLSHQANHYICVQSTLFFSENQVYLQRQLLFFVIGLVIFLLPVQIYILPFFTYSLSWDADLYGFYLLVVEGSWQEGGEREVRSYFLCCFLPKAFLSQPKVTTSLKLTLCDAVLPGSGTTPLPFDSKGGNTTKPQSTACTV